jgi:uncharacterized membrane protein SpoIIM required for sporulation
VDLDAFVATHAAEWDRLRTLARRPRRKLTPAEVDELVLRYRRVGAQLASVRSQAPDPQLVAQLTRLVLDARAAVTPSAGFRWSALPRFFTVTFPLEVYRAGRWCTGVGVAFVGLCAVLIALVATDPRIPSRLLDQAEIDQLVAVGFEAYYSEHAAQNFAFGVWTNNAWVSAICLASGVLVLPVLYILWMNALNLGLVGGVMVGNDRSDVFFGLLLVHGMLELTCIFVAAGVGLRIGWAWIAPGPARTRGQAVAAAGRSAVAVALGLVPVLLISGGVEAFVTPSALPPVVKLVLGGLVWLAFLGYVISAGRRAAHSGESSDLDPLDRAASAPTV